MPTPEIRQGEQDRRETRLNGPGAMGADGGQVRRVVPGGPAELDWLGRP